MNKRELEQHETELVRAFFKETTAGFYVEVGANDPRFLSQTWHLEEAGWRGILVEPQPDRAEQLRQHRPHSQVVQAACSSPERAGEAVLHIVSGADGLSSLTKHLDDPTVKYDRQEKVKVLTLDQILEQAGNPRIDFVSIDTEGTELDVLKGFNLERHRPALILLEDKVHRLDKHFYLKRHGYKLVKRTGVNNWYVPKAINFRMVTLNERYHLVRKMYLATPWRVLKLKLKQWRASRTTAS
jgi:FkbM family methyltransferase